jgi:hypothetical protein
MKNQSKRRFKGYKTTSERVKEFGAKVTREFAGYYVYKGVNFTAEFNEDSCERTWWSVNVYSDNVAKVVVDEFGFGGNSENNFERKKDCVYALFCLDQTLSITDEA